MPHSELPTTPSDVPHSVLAEIKALSSHNAPFPAPIALFSEAPFSKTPPSDVQHSELPETPSEALHSELEPYSESPSAGSDLRAMLNGSDSLPPFRCLLELLKGDPPPPSWCLIELLNGSNAPPSWFQSVLIYGSDPPPSQFPSALIYGSYPCMLALLDGSDPYVPLWRMLALLDGSDPYVPPWRPLELFWYVI